MLFVLKITKQQEQVEPIRKNHPGRRNIQPPPPETPNPHSIPLRGSAGCVLPTGKLSNCQDDSFYCITITQKLSHVEEFVDLHVVHPDGSVLRLSTHKVRPQRLRRRHLRMLLSRRARRHSCHKEMSNGAFTLLPLSVQSAGMIF